MIPRILSRHLARLFAEWLFVVSLFFSVIVVVFDYVEILRRTSSRTDLNFAFISKMVFCHYPNTLQQLIPFIVLFATMFTIWRLGRTSQLAVLRSIGFSLNQLLFPFCLVIIIYSVLDFTVLNPLGASLMRKFETLDSKVLRQQSSAFSISEAGLWLRHDNVEGYAIVKIATISPDLTKIGGVSVYQFNPQNQFESRIDADRAVVTKQGWQLQDVSISYAQSMERLQTYFWHTTIDLHKISGQLLSPDTLSFWELPKYIHMMEKAGLSSTKHTLYWQSLLSRPLLLLAMILLGFVGVSRSMVRKANFNLVLVAILCSFLIYISLNLSRAFGLSAVLPVSLAIWAPIGVSLFLLLAYLIHLEES